MSAPAGNDVAGRIRHGLMWSTANNLLLRVATLLLGMVLARLIAPEQFGVFAVALTVQSILMTLADLGLGAELIRCEDPERRAPTVATISLCSGVVLALLMTVSAGWVAALMRAPEATPVIIVLSWTLVLSGGSVVPYARLQREFEQRKLFACSAADFAVYTTLTIALVEAGLGPMALAYGRVGAQLASSTLQFVFTRTRPRFGFDRSIVRGAVGFGLPVAGANLLSWALLNIDNVAIARVAGAVSLGLYVLAFNMSTWPMSAIGQAVRAVSLPGFSHAKRMNAQGDRGLLTALSLTWAAALPVGVMLAALSQPLVVLLYGERWRASATVLAALGIFGALRVAFDLIATYLLANGYARRVLYVQLLWFVSLIPALIIGTRWKGIAGAGWSHLVVAALVILPAYAVALAKTGTTPRSLGTALWPPIAAAIPTWLAAYAATSLVHDPLPALVLGGAAGSVTYVALLYRWARRRLPRASAREAQAPPRVEPSLLEPVA